MADKDYSTLLKPEHLGKWIALDEGYTKILAYADTLKALKLKLSEQESVGTVYTRVLDGNFLYAF